MSNHYPKVGEKAPDFELPAVGDKKVRLSQYRGKKNVVLSFHPLAWTGICAAQMKDLQANIKLLTDKDKGYSVTGDQRRQRAVKKGMGRISRDHRGGVPG